MNTANGDKEKILSPELGGESANLQSVAQILSMWSLIESSVQGLSREDRSRLEGEMLVQGITLSFDGFESSSEGSELHTARELIAHDDRFLRLKGRDLAAYDGNPSDKWEMLSRFLKIRKIDDGYDPLSAEEIIQLFSKP